MRAGYWIIAIFAAAWAIAGLRASGYAIGYAALPVAISVVILFLAYREPTTAQPMSANTRSQIRLWSTVEGLMIAAVAVVLQHIHHSNLMFPAVAIIVGLHFVPLARAIPVRLYYATALVLVLVGLGGLMFSPSERPLVIGVGSALALWATAAYRLIAVHLASVGRPRMP